MEDKLLKKLLKIDIKNNAQYNILNAFKKFGIEGTEEKIKHIYRNCPKIKEVMLREYNNLLRRKRQ